MFKKLSALVMVLFSVYHTRRDHQLAFMAFQIRMLRRRLDGKRIIPTEVERRELVACGTKLGHEVDGLIEVVTSETYHRWLRRTAARDEPKNVGRKPSQGEIVELVLRMHRENPGWGNLRIVGELAKLGIKTCVMTVRHILERESPEPNPDKGLKRKNPIVPWSQFIEMHPDSMLACDFFCKRIWTWRGPLIAYTLMVIHLGSRRVFLTPPTFNPDTIWLQQQVRNLAMWCDDEGIQPRFLIRDNDVKFTQTGFDAMLKQVSIRGIHTPQSAPNANAFAENWIGSHKRECLNYFVCVSLQQLHRINSEYAGFFNTHRPHQGRGIGNKVLDKDFQPQAIGVVKCESRLGGLLKHYYRDSA